MTRKIGMSHLVRWVTGLLIALLTPTGASAGGLFIQEFGTPSQGTAGAGAPAIANDASTAFHNPAGMTRLDDHQLLLGAGFLWGDIKFDPSASTPVPGNDGGQQGGPAPVVGAHYVHRLLDRDDAKWFDRLRAGVSLLSISGAVLDPNSDWAGRFQVQDLSLLTVSVFPSVALQIYEGVSVGLGANLMYGRLNYETAIPLPGPLGMEGKVKFDDLDDFEAGATVSVLWELPSKRTRIGVIWQQGLNLDLSGDVKLKPTGAQANLSTKIPYPDAVRLSFLHEVNSKLWVAANLRWEDWSSFKNQFVTVRGFQGQIERGWDDIVGGSIGLRYQVAENWGLLGGVGYDASPVSADDRTADMPVDRQIRVATGLQYLWGNQIVGANFSYANLGDAKIRSDTLSGDYDRNQLFSFTMYIAFKKLPWSSPRAKNPQGT